MSMETVLITGASSGIGLELAKLFAADGAHLILVARRVDKLEALAADIRAHFPVPVDVVAADLSDPHAPDALVETLNQRGITVDVLVNNAGFGARGRIAELSLSRQMEMIQVNVTAATRLARLLVTGMLERRRGGILNVASIAAFQAGPFMGVYYATKAYLLSFSEALAEEVAGSGVTVSCLCPGPTVTEFGDVAGMTATPAFKYVAATAASVALAGYRGYRKGRVVVIPGCLNRVVTFIGRLVPRSAARRFAGALQKE